MEIQEYEMKAKKIIEKTKKETNELLEKQEKAFELIDRKERHKIIEESGELIIKKIERMNEELKELAKELRKKRS